jgi:glycosyltransferase involved in cell wall biosynthesis
MTPNKGIDVLILAFAILKTKYSHLKLALKDASNLYGIRMCDVLDNLCKQHPKLLTEEVVQSIIPMSDNLTQIQLNGLYGAADCYVSAYRAEGFNLTPLEAAASGTPIVITKGGSTDDYFHESFALQIESNLRKEGGATFLEPSLEGLVEQLSILIESKVTRLDNNIAQKFIENNFTWTLATKKLVDIL